MARSAVGVHRIVEVPGNFESSPNVSIHGPEKGPNGWRQPDGVEQLGEEFAVESIEKFVVVHKNGSDFFPLEGGEFDSGLGIPGALDSRRRGSVANQIFYRQYVRMLFCQLL